MIEQGLVTYLLGQAGVSALIGNRLHDLVLPQSPTLPAIVWQRIGGAEHDVAQDGPTKLVSARFQFSCWARTLLEAAQLAEALRLALHGYQGPMGSDTAHAVFLMDDRDLFDAETGLRRRVLDFRIWFTEA